MTCAETLSLPEGLHQNDRLARKWANAGLVRFHLQKKEEMAFTPCALSEDRTHPQAAVADPLPLPHEAQQLLWDGIFFDRSDWVELALFQGVSPDVEYEPGITAIFAAAHLNRTYSVQLFARYGASYYYSHRWDGGPAGEIDLDFVDYYEPMDCAIQHRNFEMMRVLRTLPVMQGWEPRCDDRPCDRGWDWATQLAEKGDFTILSALVQADLLTGNSDPRLASWCTERALEIAKAIKALTHDKRARLATPPRIKLLSSNLLRNKYGCKELPGAIVRIALQCDPYLRLPHSGESADLHWQDALPRYYAPGSYYSRVRFSDTMMVELCHIYDPEYDQPSYTLSNAIVYVAASSVELDQFAQTRSPPEMVARFIKALVARDSNEVGALLRRGVQLDFPWREHENVLRFIQECMKDEGLAAVIAEAAEVGLASGLRSDHANEVNSDSVGHGE